jgi:hypothetical protein
MYEVKRNIPPQGVDEKAACTPHSSVIFETAETHHPTCASESVQKVFSKFAPADLDLLTTVLHFKNSTNKVRRGESSQSKWDLDDVMKGEGGEGFAPWK